MKASIVDDIDTTEERGACEIRRIDGEVVGIANNCPGCGRAGYLPIRKVSKSDHDWQLVSVDPLTITPSVNCAGCCGWHGYLRDGEWRSV